MLDGFIRGVRVSLLGRLGRRNAACVSPRNVGLARLWLLPLGAGPYLLVGAGSGTASFTYIRRSISTKEAVFWLIPHSVPWSALKCHREGWPRQGEVTTTKRQRQGRRSERDGICLSAAHQGPGPSVLPTLFVLHSRKKYGAGGWCESSDVAWNSSGVSRAPLAVLHLLQASRERSQWRRRSRI